MCVNPVSLTRECCGKKYRAFVPCGVCEECIKDKQNEYVIRTVEESRKKGNPWFITLTYNESNVPFVIDEYDGELLEDSDYFVDKESGDIIENLRELNSEDIKLWKKRVKMRIERKFKKKLDFSYLICGEYGPATHRPHYHGILLGLTDEEVHMFEQDWNQHYGFSCFKKINITEVDRVAAYVAKYIVKMPSLEYDKVAEGAVKKPHKITSIGYGMPTKKRFDALRRDVLGSLVSELDVDTLRGINPLILDKEIKKITHKKKYKLNGREYKLPAYYWQRLTYVKDTLTGKVRSSKLSDMVSKASQSKIQREFVEKCIEMANREHCPEDYESYRLVAKSVCDTEKMEREARRKTILETNIASLRKSKF